MFIHLFIYMYAYVNVTYVYFPIYGKDRGTQKKN